MFDTTPKLLLFDNQQIAEFSLQNDSHQDFITINTFQISEKRANIHYEMNRRNYFLKFACYYLENDLNISTRLRPYRVSSDLESFFNTVAIINSKTTGKNQQFGMSAKLSKKVNLQFTGFLQLSWLLNRYDYNILSTSFTLLGGVPNYFDDQDLNITGMDAVSIQGGIKYSLGNWSVRGEFSQLLPYKTSVRKVYSQPEKTPEKKSYGGGLFTILLIKTF